MWHSWDKWECLGMYTHKVNIDIEEAKEKYRDFLRDLKLFEKTIENIFKEWPISCEHFLTKTGMNRIAWLGQASMFFYSGIPSRYKGGFKLLSNDEQKKANKVASDKLREWLYGYRKKNKKICYQLEMSWV